MLVRCYNSQPCWSLSLPIPSKSGYPPHCREKRYTNFTARTPLHSISLNGAQEDPKTLRRKLLTLLADHALFTLQPKFPALNSRKAMSHFPSLATGERVSAGVPES